MRNTISWNGFETLSWTVSTSLRWYAKWSRNRRSTSDSMPGVMCRGVLLRRCGMTVSASFQHVGRWDGDVHRGGQVGGYLIFRFRCPGGKTSSAGIRHRHSHFWCSCRLPTHQPSEPDANGPRSGSGTGSTVRCDPSPHLHSGFASSHFFFRFRQVWQPVLTLKFRLIGSPGMAFSAFRGRPGPFSLLRRLPARPVFAAMSTFSGG